MATRLAKTDQSTNPGDQESPLPSPPQSVTVEAVVSHNQYKVGDRWDLGLNDATLDLVDRGWVDVVGIDGFILPVSR